MLYLQEDIAPKFLKMLYGAMDTQIAGMPWDIRTDVGPVITQTALDGINAHIAKAASDGRVLHQVGVPEAGTFAKPTAIKVNGVEDLEEEIFGPVLHIATYKAKDLDKVVEAINASQYGLTFGVHSRIDAFVNDLCNSLNVGNIYVNRNQIGAVVGSQPFGGEGLSGTGPKAGGPDYLTRFVHPDAVDGLEYTETVMDHGIVRERLAETPRPDRTALHSTILPGPTGELNQLSTYGRGLVLCLGPTLAYAREQAKAAQSVGCTTMIIAQGATISEGLSGALPLRYLETLKGYDAVALWVDEASLRAARTALANKPGALIPLIDARDLAQRCVLERHVCIDTTAAGGNAALLAAED
jgi:RHH-type proline utilization regulon transcriptional repressor/proline dehydrogenase/delta 1-pyrroline-5-carboxylate dehydrogenase